MSQATTKQWGLTPPLSDSLPTPADMEKNAQLIEELKRENNYERNEETQKRMDTLKLLSKIHQEFVKEVSRRQRLPQSQVDQFGGKIYPYGSYRLGVYGPGSDIDTLAVAPRHIKREDFFELFPGLLQRMAGPENIQSIVVVPDSFVPIIKLILNNIEIDLIFVSIASLQTIPKNLELKDNKLLDGLDQASIKSITGPRVTDEILSLVPEHKTFRTALRAIKLWAQRRAIYANIVGFPGGVAWAMLVARVCQLYPHANGAIIVARLFFVMKNWNWPTPVMLKEIESGKEKVWNPQLYPSDRKNVMPIITPAYPSMCSTFNISKSGKNVIQRELERGFVIADGIFKGTHTWADLFKKHSFFTADHRYYLSIIASSNDAEAAKAWAGLVESKVRHLVMQLELQADIISLARPYTKGFKRSHKVDDSDQAVEVRKGSMKYKVDETTTIETTDPELVTSNGDGAAIAQPTETTATNGEAAQNVYTYTFYIGLDLTDKAVKNLNISAPIQYFKNMCATWPRFSPQSHEINVAPCKNYELPDDVFDTKAGESKPTKPAKKPKKRPAVEAENGADSQAKRRAVMGVNGTPTVMTPTPA